MKRISKSLAALFIILLSISCEDTRKLDEKAIDALKNIKKNNMDEDEYFANFITKEQIEILYNENSNSKTLARINGYSSEELYSDRLASFNETKKIGRMHRIHWEDIDFVSFVPESEEFLGYIDQSKVMPGWTKPYNAPLYAAKGSLSWSIDGHVYESEVSAIIIGYQCLLYDLYAPSLQ